jgi:hypothetical protein
MPDIREVYEMVTEQKAPEPGALERQQKRQVRTARNQRFGAFAVAAAIGIVAIVLVLVLGPGSDTSEPLGGSSADPNAEGVQVATDFLAAFGAFDADGARTYLSEDADITGLTNGSTEPDALDRIISWLESSGYQQTVKGCEATTAGVTLVTCDFDFHGIRSGEIGEGPFTGSTFSFAIRDGEIVTARMTWDIEEFSPTMWEPFAEWVSTTHPKDVEVMYNATLTDFELTDGSIRLWEQRSKEYVADVLKTTIG